MSKRIAFVTRDAQSAGKISAAIHQAIASAGVGGIITVVTPKVMDLQERIRRLEATLSDFCTCDEDGHCHACDGLDVIIDEVVAREHIEGADCWCSPVLVGDYESEGGVKHYVHNEEQ